MVCVTDHEFEEKREKGGKKFIPVTEKKNNEFPEYSIHLMYFTIGKITIHPLSHCRLVLVQS